tara:strand:+ start:60 stop:578 length:519 start_codon:yes stop_codon:yes gene_type:complete
MSAIQPCYSTNGRINIKDEINQPKTAVFTHADSIPTKEYSTYRDAMAGTWNNTILSNAFFSKENIALLQNNLRTSVYNLSNKQYLIGPQDSDELKIIMRAMFLQYSKNLPDNISNQIEVLNDYVIQYSAKKVYGGIISYMKYKDDISTIHCPMAPPEMSRPNNKQLQLKPWF